jgi:23S rRNA (adenine1618-N6)-methyltransferase
MHSRNKHKGRYNLDLLVKNNSALKSYIISNPKGEKTIDFSSYKAVIELNKALIGHYYKISNWNIPEGFLCPPVPGRADYIHHAADILGMKNKGKIPKGENIHCFEIGVGAGVIYPIIGNHEYGWKFTCSDIDQQALESSKKIISSNKQIKDSVEFRFQRKEKEIFRGIIRQTDEFDITICNPPFYSSYDEAVKSNVRKTRNLHGKSNSSPRFNFGGKSNELVFKGGEKDFVYRMIKQSKIFAGNCLMFTTLVSKEDNLRFFKSELRKINAKEFDIIPVEQGNKKTRILWWTFQNKPDIEKWIERRW